MIYHTVFYSSFLPNSTKWTMYTFLLFSYCHLLLSIVLCVFLCLSSCALFLLLMLLSVFSNFLIIHYDCNTSVMGCSTGADPVTDPTTLGSVAKIVGSWSVMKSTTGRYSYRQVVIAIMTRRRVGDIFCKASRRSITTSPKPLTDKPHYKHKP